jgi:Flp pilus assembly protein TadD
VQVGLQARADRFTYIPLIGIFVMLAWGAAEIGGTSLGTIRAAASALAVAACIVVARNQIGYWQSDLALFGHALAVTKDNWMAHQIVGDQHLSRGDVAEALPHYLEALRIKPNYAAVEINLSYILLNQGRSREAVQRLARAVAMNPGNAELRYNLGTALAASGDSGGAVGQYEAAVRLNPGHVSAHVNLGTLLSRAGRNGEALAHFTRAVELDPQDAEALYLMGESLSQMGRRDEAGLRFRQALALRPDFPAARSALARVSR